MKPITLRLVATGCVAAVLWIAWWSNTAKSRRQNAAPATAQATPPSPQPEEQRVTKAALPRAEAAQLVQQMPADSPSSSHPVESAVARGSVLDWQIIPMATPGEWTRIRLVQTEVQPRPVRVVEHWIASRGSQQLHCVRRDMYLADQLIVKAASGVSEAALAKRLEASGMKIEKVLGDRVLTVRLPNSGLDAVPSALAFLAAHPDIVESAEPDGVGFGGAIPNDSSFLQQWGFHNTGVSGGVVDADVDAPEFWDIIDGTPGIVVAVLDSGLNFTHPDLQGIAWINPGEIPGDGIDNDSNAWIDDINGWDFVNNDNNPTDDHGHGSNVTGIMAANRGNGTGIAGMLKGVRILSCKILNSSNSGTTSNLIAATIYARLRGVPVMNLSLQNYPFNSTLNTEFTACQSAGIVLCICAGNQGVNNDTTPNYPSSYTHTNIIAVGNHDRTDVRWAGSFGPSNFGVVSVDLFAPGREILSPVLGTSYEYYTGTSQATPFVTAVCAAIKYANPTWGATQIKSAVMTSVVTKPSYAGVCVTGGRLNAVDAVSRAFRLLPNQDTDGDRFSNLFEYLTGTRIDSGTSRPVVTFDTSNGFARVGVSRVARTDAHLGIETSTDLINWTTTGITDFSTANRLLGGIAITGSSRGFLRIRAFPTP